MKSAKCNVDAVGCSDQAHASANSSDSLVVLLKPGETESEGLARKCRESGIEDAASRLVFYVSFGPLPPYQGSETGL